jgi:hypothetical protein
VGEHTTGPASDHNCWIFARDVGVARQLQELCKAHSAKASIHRFR